VDKRSITLIGRLWRRDGDLVAEVHSPDRREPRNFGSGAELLAFLREPARDGIA
jgi:hypothetical protein